MGRRFGCWFVPTKVILKFGALFLFPRNHLGFYYSLCVNSIPHSVSGALIIIHPLGENIPSTRYCIFNARDSLFLLFGFDKKPMGFRKRIGCSNRLILEKKIGKRLQTLFPGDCGPGAFLWAERKVDIFQHRHRFCSSQLFSEFLGQKVTCPQALYDRFPSLIEFFEVLKTIADPSNLNFLFKRLILRVVLRGVSHMVQVSGGGRGQSEGRQLKTDWDPWSWNRHALSESLLAADDGSIWRVVQSSRRDSEQSPGGPRYAV